MVGGVDVEGVVGVVGCGVVLGLLLCVVKNMSLMMVMIMKIIVFKMY